MNPSDARELLLKAAAVQETNELYQGAYYDLVQSVEDVLDPRKCRVCALGAIAVAAGLFPNEIMSGYPGADVARAAAKLLAAHLIEREGVPPAEGDRGFLVVVGDNWADQSGRTAEKIAAVIREAAMM